MLENFSFLSYEFTYFVIANWALTLFSAILLIKLYREKKHLFFKPSILTVAAYHIFAQWHLAIYSPFYEHWLPKPWEFLFLIHGFILGSLSFIPLLFHKTASEIWKKAFEQLNFTPAKQNRFSTDISLLFLVICLFAGVYFLYVPVTETGLYVLFTDPENAGLARENSLKLLSSKLPVYSLSIIANTLAPLITTLAICQWSTGTARLLKLIFLGLIIPVVWTLASLSGAKGVVIQLILAATLTWWLKKGAVLKPYLIGIGAIIALAPAIMYASFFQFMDVQGTDFNILILIKKEIGTVIYRAFVVPFEVGAWFIHYAQTQGFVGLGGIQRVASFVGISGVDLPNIIGRTYGPEYYRHPVSDHISATAGFLFSTYACFGLTSLLLAYVFLLCMDLLYVFIKYFVASDFFIPLIALNCMAALKFMQSDFIVVWVTHGFGLIVFAAWILSVRRHAHNIIKFPCK